MPRQTAKRKALNNYAAYRFVARIEPCMTDQLETEESGQFARKLEEMKK